MIMNVIRYDPFRELKSLQDEITRKIEIKGGDAESKTILVDKTQAAKG